MALFGKKVSPFDKLLNDYNNLPDEDKAKFKASIEDVEKAEDEREIDKVEEEKAETPEKADKKAEEVKEESEEIGEDIDKDEEIADEEKGEETEEEHSEEEEHNAEEVDEKAEEEAQEDVEEATDAKMEAFFEEWETYKGKVDKLYERLEETEKPAETVGLGKQKNVEAGEDEEEMTAYDYAMKHAKY